MGLLVRLVHDDRRGLWRSAFFAMAAIILVGSVVDTGQSAVSGINDKLQHGLAFAGLALTARLAFTRQPLWTVLLPALLCFGLLIECIQYFLPWREFSLADLVADAVGLVPGVLAADVWRVRVQTRAESGA